MTYRVPHASDSTMTSLYRAELEAKSGSDRLRIGIEAIFNQFAAEHRISFHDARTLLLDIGLKAQRS